MRYIILSQKPLFFLWLLNSKSCQWRCLLSKTKWCLDVVRKVFRTSDSICFIVWDVIRMSYFLTKLPSQWGGGGQKQAFFKALFSHYNREQRETHLNWAQLCWMKTSKHKQNWIRCQWQPSPGAHHIHVLQSPPLFHSNIQDYLPYSDTKGDSLKSRLYSWDHSKSEMSHKHKYNSPGLWSNDWLLQGHVSINYRNSSVDTS